MNFCATPQEHYCGVDLHARTMLSPNSSHTGWSPTQMPHNAAPACPRADALASWAPTPGSDHRLIGHPSRSTVHTAVSRSSSSSLPLTRTPYILAACPGTRPPAPLLNGTARGNRCVSRSWGSASAPYPDTTTPHPRGGSDGRTCTRNQAGERRQAVTAVDRRPSRPQHDGQRRCPGLTPWA